MMKKIILFLLCCLVFLNFRHAYADENPVVCKPDFISPVDTQGALSMYGTADTAKTFDKKHFLTPTDDMLHFALAESFDGVNPFIPTGASPFVLKSFLYDSMMYRSPAEPFTLYPKIVKMTKIGDNREFVTFQIVNNAYFNDGSPILSKDILFTFEFLKTKGKYNYQIAYKNITAKIIDDKNITFFIQDKNRELPLILGLMPVFSHKNNMNEFMRQSDKPLLGAGAYLIENAVIGKSITLKRNPNYYGKTRLLSCTRFAFDKIKIDFFRNEYAAFENLRAGKSDFYYENDITRLHRAYHFPAVMNGDILYHKVPTYRPSGLYGFVFNTRRTPWDNLHLRQAMNMVFDFKMLNHYYLYDTENQIDSVFMASHLAYYKNGIKSLDNKTDKTRRAVLDKAFALLKGHNFTFDNGILNDPNGMAVVLNILLNNPKEEKYALLLQSLLKDIGIQTTIQTVDDAIYQKRIRDYDYDMIIDQRYVSLSPGTEQRNFWGCAGRNQSGTRNYAGICNDNIETILNQLDKARTTQDLTESISELDYEIMRGYYYIPLHARLYSHLFTRKHIKPSGYGVDYFGVR